VPLKVALSEIDDILQHVWVAGPGSPQPGAILSSGWTPLSREEALALALDLGRRSTPTDGGVCTFQVVVDGGTCPWKLDCHNCDKFVMTGADLLYWRRKREQWRIARKAHHGSAQRTCRSEPRRQPAPPSLPPSRASPACLGRQRQRRIHHTSAGYQQVSLSVTASA
jgi:hypothetical protein